jgi:hypothetical protein
MNAKQAASPELRVRATRDGARETVAASKRAVAESRALLESVRTLRSHIGERLKKKPFCTIFENELGEVFPEERDGVAARERRHAKITDFAEENGWFVTVCDPGIRAIFRKVAGAGSNGRMPTGGD